MTPGPKNRPAKVFRLGHVKATIWANAVQDTVRHSVTLTRLYKEGAVWKASASFGRDDLPLVEHVAAQAYSWIYSQGRQRAQAQGAQENFSERTLDHEVGDEG